MNNTKKTILLVGPHFDSNGGVATVNKNILNSKLIKEQYNIEFLATWNSNNWMPQFIKALISIRKKSQNSDLVHFDMSSKGSAYRKLFLIKLIRGKKYIIHLHSGKFVDFVNNSPKLIKNIIIKSLKNSEKIVCVSEYCKKRIVNELQIDDKSVECIYNGIDIREEKIEKNNDVIKVLFMGAFLDERHIKEYLALADKFKNRNDIKFYVAGTGKELDWSNHNIAFLGKITGAYKDNILCNSSILYDYFVESFGISLVECMNRGICVVGLNDGAIPEITNYGESGPLFKNISELENILNCLISNKSLLEQYQKKSYSNSLKYSMYNFEKKLCSLYDDLLG